MSNKKYPAWANAGLLGDPETDLDEMERLQYIGATPTHHVVFEDTPMSADEADRNLEELFGAFGGTDGLPNLTDALAAVGITEHQIDKNTGEVTTLRPEPVFPPDAIAYDRAMGVVDEDE